MAGISGYDPARIFSQLNNTGLQSKDNPLYQVIFLMLQALNKLYVTNNGSSSGGGGGTTFVTNNHPIQFIGFGNDGINGDDSFIPGPMGPQGPQGIPGSGGGGGGDSAGASFAIAEGDFHEETTVMQLKLPGVKVIGCDINAHGVLIAVGVKGYIQIPVAITLTGWTILVEDGNTGDIVIDVWVDTYANFPPTVLDTITAAAKPTITGGNKATSTTLTGWNTTIPAGSVLAVNVDSASGLTRVIFELYGTVNS